MKHPAEPGHESETVRVWHSERPRAVFPLRDESALVVPQFRVVRELELIPEVAVHLKARPEGNDEIKIARHHVDGLANRGARESMCRVKPGLLILKLRLHG